MKIQKEGLQAIIGVLAVGLVKTYLDSAQQAETIDNRRLLDVDYLLHKMDEALRCQELYDATARCAQRAGLRDLPPIANHAEVASAFASATSKLIASGEPYVKKTAIDSLRRIRKDYEQQMKICKSKTYSYESDALPETSAVLFRYNYAQEASKLYERILAGLHNQERAVLQVKQVVVRPKVCLDDVKRHSPERAESEELQFNELMAFAMPNLSWQMPIIAKAVNLR